jgi:hypothetical protein
LPLQAFAEEYDGGALRMLGLRNPHGKTEWNGKFSDYDEENRDFVTSLYERNDGEAFAAEIANDGFFYIEFEDFVK